MAERDDNASFVIPSPIHTQHPNTPEALWSQRKCGNSRQSFHHVFRKDGVFSMGDGINGEEW